MKLTSTGDLNGDGDEDDKGSYRVQQSGKRLSRVGNIAPAGSGSFAITPDKAYETYDESRRGSPAVL